MATRLVGKLDINLFNWKVESGWNEFWVVGKDNYQSEMEFYGFLSEEEVAQRP
jgi:hypothetical protein